MYHYSYDDYVTQKIIGTDPKGIKQSVHYYPQFPDKEIKAKVK